MGTRERIMELIAQGQETQISLAKKLKLSEATISYHISILEREGKIDASRSTSKFLNLPTSKSYLSPSNLDSNFPSKSHIPKTENVPSQSQEPMAQYLHRLQRNYPILERLKQARESLEITSMRNNIQEHGEYKGQDFRITTKHLELEGVQLWAPYNISTDLVLKPVGEAYADGLARAIAEKYGLVIGEGDTRQLEIEQVDHAMAQKIKGKGKIAIHHNEKGDEDLWTDLSFGFRGMESNAAKVLGVMTRMAADVIDHNAWDRITEDHKLLHETIVAVHDLSLNNISHIPMLRESTAALSEIRWYMADLRDEKKKKWWQRLW